MISSTGAWSPSARSGRLRVSQGCASLHQEPHERIGVKAPAGAHHQHPRSVAGFQRRHESSDLCVVVGGVVGCEFPTVLSDGGKHATRYHPDGGITQPSSGLAMLPELGMKVAGEGSVGLRSGTHHDGTAKLGQFGQEGHGVVDAGNVADGEHDDSRVVVAKLGAGVLRVRMVGSIPRPCSIDGSVSVMRGPRVGSRGAVHTVATVVFCVVEGTIGAFVQRVNGFVHHRCAGGNTDAGGHIEAASGGVDGSGTDHLAVPVACSDDFLGVRRRKQHGELLAPHPGNEFVRTAPFLEATADLDQYLVADGVPIGVVDGFEVVEVEDHDAEPSAERSSAVTGDDRFDLLVEGAAVGQSGERVGQCLGGESLVVGGQRCGAGLFLGEGGNSVEGQPSHALAGSHEEFTHGWIGGVGVEHVSDRLQ